MYWLLDIAVLALLAVVAFLGFKKGIFGMLVGVGAFLLRFLYTVIVTGIMVYLFEVTGLIDALTVPLTKTLGESTLYPAGTLANVLSAAIFAVIGVGIAIVTLIFIVRAVKKSWAKREHVVTLASSIIGMVVAILIYLVFVYMIFGFIHAIADCGGLPSLDELLRACPISGFMYRANPFTAMFGGTGLPQNIVNVFNGNFNQVG